MLRDDRGNGGGRRLIPRNVLGEPLDICSIKPMSGFYRDGCCNTGKEDIGSHIPVETGNAAAKAGTLGSTVEQIVADLKPEAAYFFNDDNGNRSGSIVFDLKDSSQYGLRRDDFGVSGFFQIARQRSFDTNTGTWFSRPEAR